MNNDARMKHKKKQHIHTQITTLIPICISSFDAVMESKVISPARLFVLTTPTQDLRMLGSVNNI